MGSCLSSSRSRKASATLKKGQITALAGHQGTFETALDDYMRDAVGRVGNRDSCNTTSQFIFTKFCGGLDNPQVIGTAQSDENTIVDGAINGLNGGNALYIFLSGPDHHWSVIPTGNDENVVYMSWQGLFSMHEFIQAGCDAPLTDADIRAAIAGLRHGNRANRVNAMKSFIQDPTLAGRVQNHADTTDPTKTPFTIGTISSKKLLG